MGVTCSNPDFRGTFGVTADEISINCKDYVNSESKNCMDNGSILDDLHPFGVPSKKSMFNCRTDSIRTLFEYNVESDNPTLNSQVPWTNSYYNRKRNSFEVTKTMSKKESISILKESQLQRSLENKATRKKSLVLQNWISGELDNSVLEQ
ncbi:hypothetical protein LOTGIDRAFT_172643 [Lottia gigantea]|uniref:Uncharacterized protein n=1 Tax=Lottia gigantea TaxID=225164 RepID=V4AC18_LOTGI|nr:hypothetical protein LOTGIDRAFT_172643 [Lottia gigantea]ESP01544.1 hypothetical protein LOTGIDRAFT_172643 [Lottia gigantea]